MRRFTVSDAPPVIRVEGLRKSFRGHLNIGKTVAVDGVDLEVRPGEIFGLLGPNGSGKTTTIKMLLGLMKADAGEIEILGGAPKDVASRVGLGYLPENPYFYDYLTAREFLDFYARLRGIPTADRKTQVEAVIERVGLKGRADRAMRKFSKGMLQRVGMAQAIQHHPKLVILDEPMSGLDPIGRRDVRDIILELRNAGSTIMFTSHILQDAEMICDRVAILREGRVAAVGSLHDLIDAKPKWVEVEVYGTLPPELPAELISSDGRRHLLRVDSTAELNAILPPLQAHGAEVANVWSRRQHLEDLFVETVEADGSTPNSETRAHG